MLLNIIFRCWESLVYFRSCDLENQTAFLPPVLAQAAQGHYVWVRASEVIWSNLVGVY